MKINYPFSLLALCCLTFGSIPSAHAQRYWKEECDESGKNCHVDNEILVQFKAQSLNMATVNDSRVVSGPLQSFLIPSALDSLSDAAGFDLSTATVYKVAPYLTSEQTTMVDNTGETVEIGDVWSMFLVVLPLGIDEQAVCYQLRSLFPLVRFAHLNWTVEPTSTPNDGILYDVNQSSLHPTTAFPNASINVEGAWDYTTGKSTIKVGVADTGIRQDHADLQFNGTSVVAAGYDGIIQSSPGYSLQDPTSHGTAVAGIIGAVRNNGIGIAGIAGGNGSTQGVSLYSLKCLGTSGTSPLGNIYSVTNAIFKGAMSVANGGYGLQIINNSHTGTVNQTKRLFREYAFAMNALRFAHRAKVTMVVGAGNSIPFAGDYLFPAQARDNWTLTVGGANQLGRYYNEIPAFGAGGVISAPHPFVDVAAPASNDASRNAADQTVHSLSALSPTSYQVFQHTSAAAPHASGVAALMMSYHNNAAQPAENLQPEDVENLLKFHSRDITNSPAQIGEDDATGAGLIDATAVMEGLRFNRLYHSPAAPANPLTPGMTITPVPGGPQDYYMEGGERLPAGVYNAQAYRVRINAPASYSPNYQVSQRWGINSNSSFYGSPEPFTGLAFTGTVATPGQMVVLEPAVNVVGPAGKSTVVLEGYTYQLNSYRSLLPPAIFGQPEQINPVTQPPFLSWIPFDPNTNPNQDVRSMRYASYAVSIYGPYFRGTVQDGSGMPGAENRTTAYPNPTTDRVRVAFAAEQATCATTAEVQVSTIDGRRVLAENKIINWVSNASGTVEVSLGNLPAGVYLYRIVTNNTVYQGRVS